VNNKQANYDGHYSGIHGARQLLTAVRVENESGVSEGRRANGQRRKISIMVGQGTTIIVHDARNEDYKKRIHGSGANSKVSNNGHQCWVTLLITVGTGDIYKE
jgi:hypothetical protein